MDISAAFYSIEKGMSAPTEITHTTGRTERLSNGWDTMLGDYCGDTSPKAAYDSETGRILLYYIKSDYYDGTSGEIAEGSIDESESSISPEEAQLVVGDIVNAFSLITYRYAVKDAYGNWVWNDSSSYTDLEIAQMDAMINTQVEFGSLPEGYTVQDYMNDWYGQRFLDVSQYADVIETWTSNGDVNSDFDGYNYSESGDITVRHEAALRRTPIEPRVVDTAVISYNGLALFAYSTDEDWDLKTDNDQEIYLQIYNFSEDSFSHPIRLTTDVAEINGKVSTENCVKDSQPKFVRSNGITYLFWNRNGSIAYMDISGLVKYGLKKINLGMGTEIYVIDKGNDNYTIAYESGYDMKGKEASTGKWGEIILAVDKAINPNPSEDNEATADSAITSYDVVASDDGDVTLLDTKFNGTYYMDSESASEAGKFALVGGDGFTAQMIFEMPENNGDVSIKAVLRYVDSDGLEQSIEAQKSFTFEAVPEISDLRYEFTGIGKIVLDGTITNAGNKDDTLNVEISLVDRYGTENTVAFVPVTLKQGESSYFLKELEIPDSCFTEVVPEAGSSTDGIKEFVLIKVGMGAIRDEITVVRSAAARALEVMNEVTGFSVSNKSVSIRK